MPLSDDSTNTGNKESTEHIKAEKEATSSKKQKTILKAKLTRIANELLELIGDHEDEAPSRADINAARKRHTESKDAAIGALLKLCEIYEGMEKIEKADKCTDEIEAVLEQYLSVEKEVQEHLAGRRRRPALLSAGSSSSRGSGSLPSEEQVQEDLRVPLENNSAVTNEVAHQRIGQDMWRQLERVSVPKFNGTPSAYPSWKAAFTACVDEAPATPVYKLLQLKQCLQGEPLKIIERLGHSAEAYLAAKECLERKYGGERRLVAIYLNELENFRPIKEGQTKALEKLADILNVAIVNLKEAGRIADLRSVSFHSRLQQKLPESILINYRRWLLENKLEESVEVLRDFVVRETEFYSVARDTLQHTFRKDENQHNIKSNHRTFVTNFSKNPAAPTTLKPPCVLCSGAHPVWKCEEFLKQDVPSRWNIAKQKGMCFRCLGTNHLGRTCSKRRECGINGCRLQHNRLLHSDRRRDEPVNSTRNSSELPKDVEERNNSTSLQSAFLSNSSSHSSFVALRTVPVVLKNGARAVKVNALLDDASTRSYLNADIAGELGIQGALTRVSVGVLNGQVETFETSPVQVFLESINGKMSATISALTTDRVTGSLQVVDWRKYRSRWRHLEKIPFPQTAEKPYVDLLLGADYLDLQCCLEEVKGAPGEPIARRTPLGWTCVGDPKLSISRQMQGHTHFTLFSQSTEMQEIDRSLRRFWEVEEVRPPNRRKSFDVEEQSIIDITAQSIEFREGRYHVEVPKKNMVTLPEGSFEMALKRLNSTEKGLARKPEVAKEYCNTIEKYIEKGYVVKKDSCSPEDENAWYLPHFPVVRQDKETTKVRIVFDASAKCKGVSLNDKIDPGPKLQNELFHILVNFRKYPVALICDISEMYLQIGLKDSDKSMHRFLWRGLDFNGEPEIYEFQRVVFGVNASPFLAQLVLREHANRAPTELFEARNALLYSTYMDDTMASLANENAAFGLYEQMVTLLGQAGMRPHKWLTNSKRVLQALPAEDRKLKWKIENDVLPTAKTLGVIWEADRDEFTFSGNNLADFPITTKRTFLKVIARLFDPLGLLVPFVVRAKILMQRLWTAGYDWDEHIDKALLTDIQQWAEELTELHVIKVPRCVQATGNQVLHVFVDASKDAYGAACYLRTVDNCESVCVRLVAAKSKVAPVSAVSIPRLELMAAILGLKLAISISEIFDIADADIVFWSDSMTVLWWIRGHSRNFKPFVANRVAEIQSATSPQQWRHVATDLNAADHASRGLTVKALSDCELWWQGPTFLTKPESEWPKSKLVNSDCVDTERRRQAPRQKTDVTFHASAVNLSNQEQNYWRLNPERFSKWTRLIRVRAWVHRFVQNCRSPLDQRVKGCLTVDEINDQETAVIVDAQRSVFSHEYALVLTGKRLPLKCELLSLNPKIDDDGLMRCDSRLQYAEHLPYRTRFPIILPKKSVITKLLISHYDALGNHALGINHLLANLQERFWIIRGREAVKEWKNSCNTCSRKKAKPAQQLMAPLPKCRFQQPMKAFSRVAVDFAGPYLTIQGRAKKRQKRYLCLFTCLACRAVHLEMAFSLTTDSFLNAFCRMVSRRGLPLEVISDNGTNFVGARNELHELLCNFDQDKISDSLANRGIKWCFNPPSSPHFGGVFEIMIKSAKKAIAATMTNADITDEEFMTAIAGAESLINSRPLTYQTADPKDDTPLTPNHFLHGQVGGCFAPESIDELSFNIRKRWRRVQEIVKHFWGRWMKEWLPMLHSRKKWKVNTENVQEGSVVLVIRDGLPRGHWPLGRICEVYPGKDQRVRVVKVQVGKNCLVRPITKVCPLELD